MVLDYDLLHRNKLSTLFLSSILTRGWVALTSCFFSPISEHSESYIVLHPSISAQNAVQDMASKSYGRLGVAEFLSPDPTNICLQKRAISPG